MAKITRHGGESYSDKELMDMLASRPMLESLNKANEGGESPLVGGDYIQSSQSEKSSKEQPTQDPLPPALTTESLSEAPTEVSSSARTTDGSTLTTPRQRSARSAKKRKTTPAPIDDTPTDDFEF